MILMALDHTRWFFTDTSAWQPETLAVTNLWLFLTRWVTHFCAPGSFCWPESEFFCQVEGAI